MCRSTSLHALHVGTLLSHTESGTAVGILLGSARRSKSRVEGFPLLVLLWCRNRVLASAVMIGGFWWARESWSVCGYVPDCVHVTVYMDTVWNIATY